MGNFIAWDASKGEIVWSIPEQFSVWSGALATAGDVVFYGTLEGYIKAVDNDGKELYKFKTPSGIIGNVNTYEHDGKQYIAVLSGVGGWAGIGLAGGLLAPENAAAWQRRGRRQGRDAGCRGTASSDGRSRRGRRLRRPCRVHCSWRPAHRVRPAGLKSKEPWPCRTIVGAAGSLNERARTRLAGRALFLTADDAPKTIARSHRRSAQ